MKKFLSFLLVVVVTFIGVITVKVEDYKIDVKVQNLGDVEASMTMYVSGPFDFNNYSYSVWFANENDQAPTPGRPSDSNNRSIVGNWFNVSEDGSGRILMHSDWYMLEGYDYAYIQKYEKATNQYSLASSKIKVEKPALPANKAKYGFSSILKGNLSVFIYYPHSGYTGNHKLYVKTGKITNTSLIKEYNNNKFDNLFTYVKNDSSDKSTLCTLQTDTGSTNDYECELSNIEIGSYYYVYFYTDDPLYRNLDSVVVAVGKDGLGEANYLHYLETVDIGSDNEVFTGDVVANPKTADFKLIVIVSLVVITILVSIIGRKKLVKIVKK